MSTIGPWRPEYRKPRGRLWAFSRWPRRGRVRGTSTLESPGVRERINARIKIIEGFALVVVGVLLFNFWRLQIVRAERYTELAENNRIRDLVVRPPRGLIVDRNGRLLAANRAAFNVAIVREDVRDLDATLRWLAGVLDQPVDELSSRLARNSGTPAFRPVVIADDVARDVVATVEAHQRENPGVLIQPEHKRYYPQGTLAAHVLGHVGEISREELDSWGGERFRMGDIVGKYGIELMHNEDLAGIAGEREVVVNSTGRIVAVRNEMAPKPGRTLTLTLDMEVQRAAEELLAGIKGSIVALDVTSGAVLAMASSPTFDPNFFAGRFRIEEWNELINDPAKPLQNRALQSSFPPGSVFKLAMAIAGLEEGAITPSTRVFCPGGGVFFGSYRRCWRPGGHGTVNLLEAITQSCNVYFYTLGEKLGREKIVQIAQRFGLGAPTGIDLPNERAGVVPSDEWLAAVRGAPWQPGETISLAIGQGALDVTPLQLARLTATVATGRALQPHLVQRTEEAAGAVDAVDWQGEAHVVDIDPGHRRLVLEGMRRVVNDIRGSGWRAKLSEVQIGGKTGSAQVASAENAGPEENRPEELRNHAWFVAIAPIDNPRIAVAIFLEHGGSGGQAAAPVGGRFLGRFFEIEKRRATQMTDNAAATEAAGDGGSR